MHNSLLHLLLKNGDFLNTDISQGSVATRLGCGGVYVYDCYKFPTESNSERILKIGQYLVKLWARVRCVVFLTHSVDALPEAQSAESKHQMSVIPKHFGNKW